MHGRTRGQRKLYSLCQSLIKIGPNLSEGSFKVEHMKRKYATTRKDSKLFNNGPTIQTCFPKIIKKEAKLKAGLKLDWAVYKEGTVLRTKALTLVANVKEDNEPVEVVS